MPSKVTKRLAPILLAISALNLALMHVASAETLPDYPVDLEVFRSDLIVRARLTETNHVQIEQVFNGNAKIGEILPVERLLNLTRQKYDVPVDDFSLSRMMQSDPPQVPHSSQIDGDLILFLVKDDKQQWIPYGWGAGVKWLVGDQVFGYQQLTNPGGYTLMSDPEADSGKEFHRLMRMAIAKKARFQAAKSAQSPRERLKKLSQFIEPQERGYWYVDEALDGMSKLGPLADSTFHRAVEDERQVYHRTSILRAWGRSRTPEAISYLIGVAERSSVRVQADSLVQGPPIAPGATENLYRFTGTEKQSLKSNRARSLFWGEGTKMRMASDEQKAYTDWNTSIVVLADAGNERAVPVLRDALLWGAAHGGQSELMEYAAHGLARFPSRENTASFAKALALIPPGPNSSFPVSDCLRAMRDYKYLESVPVLAAQLKENSMSGPNAGGRWAENISKAHELLVGIAGKDLGKEETAWLNWAATQPQ